MSPSWPASDEETSRPFTVRLDVTPTLSTVRLTNDASLQERELGITKLMEAGVLEPPYIEVKFERLGIDVFCYRHRTKEKPSNSYSAHVWSNRRHPSKRRSIWTG